MTFDDWIMRVMGEGIANLFMRPYNFKVRPENRSAVERRRSPKTNDFVELTNREPLILLNSRVERL